MRTRLLVMAAVMAAGMSVEAAASAHSGGDGHERGGPPAHGEHRSTAERQGAPNATLSFKLSGSRVPGGGDPNGRGSAVLRLDTEQDVVCLRTGWAGLAGEVTAIHIHRAPEGKTGSHHVDILEDEHLAGSSNQVELCVQPAAHHHAQAEGAPSADPIQEMIDHPAEFYLNVHSSEFPGGAIRGQLAG